jgi:hypothetical protein
MNNKDLAQLKNLLTQFGEVVHGNDLQEVKEMHDLVEIYLDEQKTEQQRIEALSDEPDDYSSATSSN